MFDYSEFIVEDNPYGQFRSGETIGPRHLQFENEAAELFSFDAIVTAFRRTDGTTSGSSSDGGSGGGDGDADGTSLDESSQLLRFTVDPLTGTVSVELLDSLLEGSSDGLL